MKQTAMKVNRQIKWEFRKNNQFFASILEKLQKKEMIAKKIIFLQKLLEKLQIKRNNCKNKSLFCKNKGIRDLILLIFFGHSSKNKPNPLTNNNPCCILLI